MKRQRPRECPRLAFDVELTEFRAHVSARDTYTNAKRGYLSARGSRDYQGRRYFSVSNIHVDEELRGCGVGTQLYTLLGRAVCARGAQVQSDVERTRSAEAFWRKQRRKGRATCEPSTKYARGVVMVADEGGWAHGRIRPADPPRTWPCFKYTLNCPVVTLDGLRGRR